jgi:ABC-type polysaccharide/polyol phosphate transport system ATPase subunit
MTSKTTSIKLTKVSKRYQITHQKPTLTETLLNIQRRQHVWALKDLSLTIKKGEKIGIIGNNGSGKTTLLKLIAGISTPTHGTITTHGRLVSLIDLNAGFHPDLSGYENIFLNGMLLGMTKQSLNRVLTEIIDFADIGDFIDAPLYTYSLGMRLRLAFSICIHTKADIFLMDEGIYAGDHNFQQKIHHKLQQLFQEKQITFLITSHIVDFLKTYCDRCLWLEAGRMKAYGPIDKIITQYQDAPLYYGKI